MTWTELFPQAQKPELEKISGYISSPLWEELQGFLAETYGAAPSIEYSRCGLEPGWNVKYKKGSRSLCTVYARPGYATVMISIGAKDEDAAQGVLAACTDYTRDLYGRTASSRMGRWLMIDVTTPEILEDVKALLLIRAKPIKKEETIR